VSVTGARVLIVEDDQAIRELLARVFSRGGFVVRSAAEGREALRLLEEETPDLIVLDLVLPEVNGMQVLVTVRQHPRLAKVPVLVETGTATSADDLRDFSPLYVLYKPFQLATVLPAAEELLRAAGH
jgi:two-component system, OmpR family, response regulator